MLYDPSIVSALVCLSSGNNCARRVGDSRCMTIPLTDVGAAEMLSDPWHLRDNW